MLCVMHILLSFSYIHICIDIPGPLQNPCSQSPCDQICIAKSNTEHQCLCESGSTWASTRGTCVSDPSAIISKFLTTTLWVNWLIKLIHKVNFCNVQ